MDLIGGIVVVTSAFLIASAAVGLRATGAPWPDDERRHDVVETALQQRLRPVFATLLIAYFLGIADLFVTAQLPAVAFVNLIVGAGALAVLVATPRQRPRPTDEETWRR